MASKFLDGLSGDALTAAMDIGREKVVAKYGIPTCLVWVARAVLEPIGH